MFRQPNQEVIHMCCSHKFLQQMYQGSKKDVVFKKVRNFAFLASLKTSNVKKFKYYTIRRFSKEL